MAQRQPVTIILYRWAGAWGPFKVSIPCGECTLTRDIISDTVKHELAGIGVELQVHDWLSCWWRPLQKGAWHAPIVMVDGRVISQGAALNRGVLTQAVAEAYAFGNPVVGNVLFGKQGCPHCQRAKVYLEQTNTEYQYFDVINQPRALYEMLARVKPLTADKTPISVPQIWLNGCYVGGADQLAEQLKARAAANVGCALGSLP